MTAAIGTSESSPALGEAQRKDAHLVLKSPAPDQVPEAVRATAPRSCVDRTNDRNYAKHSDSNAYLPVRPSPSSPLMLAAGLNEFKNSDRGRKYSLDTVLSLVVDKACSLELNNGDWHRERNE